MIKLDMRTVLPAARKAFNEGRLQAQTATDPMETCRYAGPCAIGAALDPKIAALFDASKSPEINWLIIEGEVFVPEDQVDDFIELQREHDNAVGGPIKPFVETLTRLEAKYAD